MLAVNHRLTMTRISVQPIVILLAAAMIFVLARPLLALLHEGLVFAVAFGLRTIGQSNVIPGALGLFHSDPIYSGAAASLLSDVDVAGLAVAEPLGTSLHAALPSIFLDPSLIQDGAFVSALILPGSTLVARGLTFLLADLSLLSIGWGVWRWAVKRGTDRIGVILAVTAGAQVTHLFVDHLLTARIAMRDLESLGLPFAISALFRGAPQDRPRVTSLMLGVPENVMTMALGLALAVLAMGLAILLSEACQSGFAAFRQLGTKSVVRTLAHVPWQHHAAVAAIALTLGVSPLANFTDAESRVLSVREAAPTIIEADLPVESALVPTPVSKPTSVSIHGDRFHYQYLINDVPTEIQGMGYNVQYSTLPEEEREARYDRDFARMRRAGVNTVFGWNPAEFDELLLDRAAAFGLGVAPPFDLSPDADYTDPAVRAETMGQIKVWVTRYKNYPAVRMWAIGNEVLHKLVYPSWMSVQADPWREQRAVAFAHFLVEITDEVHAIDPLHPITHRDAEDAYARYVRDAFNADGIRRPWFLYGINIYTPRIQSLIESWPLTGFDTPLFISEFAPGGLGPADRPTGLREMWDVIKASPERVLGGAVYAWTTNGPEEVDRVFGLVGDDGHSVDGALRAVAGMYGGQIRETAVAVTPVPIASDDHRVRALVRETIAEIQERGNVSESSSTQHPFVLGALDSLPRDVIQDSQISITQVSDTGTEDIDTSQSDEFAWWATWNPPSRASTQIALLIEAAAGSEPRVSYIYHGPR